MKRTLILMLVVAVVVALGSAAAFAGKKTIVAFISNGPYTFWTYAHAGCLKAEKQFGMNVEFYKPPNALVEEQKRFIETMMAKGVKAVAISVIDPQNMTPFLNEIASSVPLICFDSDAPDSKRKAYVGMSNYAAGRLAGKAIMDQLPSGGDLAIFVGRLDAQNAIERRQGIIDELQGKAYQAQYPGQMSPGGKVVCGKWIIIDTRTDGGDESRAKGNAEDILVKYPDLDLMIGLWSYNTPAIISAVKDAGKLGKIKIIGFDEEKVVLQGIQAGHVYGTIVQNPYEYGRMSSELMFKLATGQDAGIPANKLVDVPARLIKKNNVDAFLADINAKLVVGEAAEK